MNEHNTKQFFVLHKSRNKFIKIDDEIVQDNLNLSSGIKLICRLGFSLALDHLAMCV